MINEKDISTYPGPSPDMLRYIEKEASDLYVSAETVSRETGMDQKQALWTVVTLYVNFHSG
jgi:hypothetical protein